MPIYTEGSQMPGHRSDPLSLTILYEEAEGEVIARVKEVPGAISHGKSREEARESVLDALRELALSYLDESDNSAQGAEAERLTVFAETA